MHLVWQNEDVVDLVDVIFDKTNLNWHEKFNSNGQYLSIMERHLFDKMRAQGHLFVNEVLDQLGIERVAGGQVLGWIASQHDGSHLFMFDQREEQEGSINVHILPQGVIWPQFVRPTS